MEDAATEAYRAQARLRKNADAAEARRLKKANKGVHGAWVPEDPAATAANAAFGVVTAALATVLPPNVDPAAVAGRLRITGEAQVLFCCIIPNRCNSNVVFAGAA